MSSKEVNDENIKKKLGRLQIQKPLRVLDLFAGCGGLSLGFKKNGFKIIAGIEVDKDASKTHALNFHQGHAKFAELSKPRNIEDTSPAQLFLEIGLKGDIEDQIDIIIGGPPCQAFTRIGRAKLRETLSDSQAFLNDPRSQLYKRYLEYVRFLEPVAILMENVPDMLNYGGVNIAELVCNDLTTIGYKCRYTLLNTAHFGVPQMRERMFLIALHKSIDAEISFPIPTHFIELPKGYHGSRSVALKNISPGIFNQYYTPMPKPSTSLPMAVTAEHALSDLPPLVSHLTKTIKRGIKRSDLLLPYYKEPQNDYQALMRNWTGLSESDMISGCIIRQLPRDYPIFQRMQPGDQYPQAVKVGHELLRKKITEAEKAYGAAILPGSIRYNELLKSTIPPYDVQKFPNKWRKMEPDKPARTLMAHLGKDSYSHIHYDSNQARTISVREAARLQSFPDTFEFSGSMNAAFKQIGNAVPPLMAAKLAELIKGTIEKGIRCQQKETSSI